MANFIDIGINLMSPSFDRDRTDVIARAGAAGVKGLVITGSNIENSITAYKFAADHQFCRTTAGVHPHNAKDWNGSGKLKEIFTGEESAAGIIAAVGECGLDYNRDFSPRDAQRKCFEDQLALAALLGKPVFLHERDASGDFSAILKKYRGKLPGAVVHCFTGTEAELEAYLALDCYIGITGWICDERRGTHLIPLLRQIPPNRLLLETDAPYLLPRNLPRTICGKNGRNEPCFLPHIAAFAAGILGKTTEQIAEETSANAARLFNFSLPI